MRWNRLTERKKKKIISRDIVEFVAIGLIALILALSLTVGMKSYLGSSTPQVAVTTQSMEPTYQGFEEKLGTLFDPLDGDLLLVQKKEPANIRPGDVIVFDHPSGNERIVHRVVDVKIDENGKHFFKTKGDNPATNALPDFWEISEDSVYGVVVFRIPFIGWIALEIQRGANRWLLFLLAASLLLLSFRDNKEDTEEATKDNGQGGLFQTLKTGNILALIKKEIISFARSRKIIIVGLIFGLIFLSFISSIQVAFSPCRITLINIEDSYSVPHHGKWTGTDDVSRSFIALTISLESNGLFNHISGFEIKANNTLAFRWTIVYTFQGTKTIAAGLVLNTTIGTHDFVIVLIPHCSGLFAKGETSQYILRNIQM